MSTPNFAKVDSLRCGFFSSNDEIDREFLNDLVGVELYQFMLEVEYDLNKRVVIPSDYFKKDWFSSDMLASPTLVRGYFDGLAVEIVDGFKERYAIPTNEKRTVYSDDVRRYFDFMGINEDIYEFTGFLHLQREYMEYALIRKSLDLELKEIVGGYAGGESTDPLSHKLVHYHAKYANISRWYHGIAYR